MRILILFTGFVIGTGLASASDLKNYLFDMGTANSKVASGYTRVTPMMSIQPNAGMGLPRGFPVRLKLPRRFPGLAHC